MTLWWLSFCDPERPRGTQFLGVCIVGGASLPHAAANAHIFGCNPGGEVAGAPIPEGNEALVPRGWRRRLLSRADVDALDAAVRAARGRA